MRTAITACVLITALHQPLVQGAQSAVGPCSATQAADQNLQLGAARAYAEMVAAGVKRLALSSVMTTDEADAMEPLLGDVAAAHGVQLYREPDFLITLLFPADVATDKTVFLIYKGDVLHHYLELKQERRNLQDTGGYDQDSQRHIARRFGELLSYPDSTIERFIAAQETTLHQ